MLQPPSRRGLTRTSTVTVIEIFERINPVDPAFDRALDEVDGVAVAGDASPEQARKFAFNVIRAVNRWAVHPYAGEDETDESRSSAHTRLDADARRRPRRGRGDSACVESLSADDRERCGGRPT